MNSKLYKSIDVWERQGEDCAIRYRCFEILGESKFCVQSVDYYFLPFSEEQRLQLEKQFVELIIEQAPDDRSGFAPTLEEAIAKYKAGVLILILVWWVPRRLPVYFNSVNQLVCDSDEERPVKRYRMPYMSSSAMALSSAIRACMHSGHRPWLNSVSVA